MPFHPIAPAEHPHERPDDEPVQRRIELTPFKTEPVDRPAESLRQPPRAVLMRETSADGVLERVLVVEQRRRPEQLERSEAGMSDDVNEREVTQSQADLDRDDSDLRQRSERERALRVGLDSTGDLRKDRRRQAERHDRRTQPERSGQERADSEQ